MLIAGQNITFLKPIELKRDDGRRGVSFARVGRDLVVIPLEEGDTWMIHPEGGIIIIHPLRNPLWCRLINGKYTRTVMEIN